MVHANAETDSSMTPQQRLAGLCAWLALSLSVLTLGIWLLLWRVLLVHPLASWAYVMPLSALIAAAVSIGLLLARRDDAPVAVQAVSVAVMSLAVIVLLQHLLGLSSGIEATVLQEATHALLGGTSPGRPAPQAALMMLFLGLALWGLGRPREKRYDLSDLGIGMALFIGFTVLLGHLFEARSLYEAAGGGMVGMSLLETFILMALSIGALALNPQGSVAELMTPGTAGEAKRRLLPAIILTPVLLGVMQYWAMRLQILEIPVVLALAITANIAVFIALSEWVGAYLVKLEEQRTGVFVQRETKAKEEGMTDMLTGLLNRRGWDQQMSQSEARCQRENLNACVIVIDLDGLKRINDTEGHGKGDEFIRRAGTALKLAARRDEILARLGGDEFACLSVGCAPEHAGVVLKRLSQALEKAAVPASLGYAMRDLAGSLGGAFHEADQAMYRHKRHRKAKTQQTAA